MDVEQKKLKGAQLSAEEVAYILGILKEHLNYYRLLDSDKHRKKRALLEGLWAKLQG